MEEMVQNKAKAVKPKYSRRKILRNGFVLLLALLAGYLHYSYVSTLHENHFHFSHLSELERELTLRTEMGFYYSYYKTVVQEQPFLAAVSRLMYDRTVEFPNEVNAFNRFNIYPEVVLGGLYRQLEPWLERGACVAVSRGGGLPPVSACAGLQEPLLFYLHAVWLLAGAVTALLFIHSVELSGSVLGGVLSVAQYFANHQHATRVQRAPNERENLALPLLLAQSWLLTLQLRNRDRGTFIHLQVSMLVLNCVCLLSWQLSQFVLLAQVAILFCMEQLRLISTNTLCVLLHSHFCGLHMAVLLTQGNDMLKSSLYTSFFLVVSAYCLFFSSFRIKVKTKLDLFVEAWLVFLRICIVICASLYLKKVISDFLETEDDNHIWELLLSKFTNYRTFHTMMYTCIDVFDFLPISYFYDVSKTLLLPLAVGAIVYHFATWISNANVATEKYFNDKSKKESTKAKTESTKTKKSKATHDTIDKNKSTDEKVDADDKSDTKDADSDDSGIENNSEGVVVKDVKRLDLDKLKEIKESKDNVENVMKNRLDLDRLKDAKGAKGNVDDSIERRLDLDKLKVSKENEDDSIESRLDLDKLKDFKKAKSNVDDATEDRLDLDKLKPCKEAADDVEDAAECWLVVWLRSVLVEADAALVYGACQLLVLAVLAALFMRLKLLLSAQLCVLSALAMSTSSGQRAGDTRPAEGARGGRGWGRGWGRGRWALWAVAAPLIALQVYTHVTQELAVRGEFSDYSLEQLIVWFRQHTTSGGGAVVAGSMPVSAAVLLSARRAVVSHPHYEHKEARARAYSVHKVYGRFTARHVYEELSRLRATYLIVETRLCYGRTTQGCTLLDMWDAEGRGGNVSSPSTPVLCRVLLSRSHTHEPESESETEHLYRVFSNHHYTVYRVHDLSLRYMPRVFDS